MMSKAVTTKFLKSLRGFPSHRMNYAQSTIESYWRKQFIQTQVVWRCRRQYDHSLESILANRLVQKIMSEIPDVVMNGDPDQTSPALCFTWGESLLMALNDVALSSGSACTSASLKPSCVLRAIGTDEDLAHSSVSPLWEMMQEGIYIKSIKWTQH